MEKSVWDGVKEITEVAQEKGRDPLLWATQVSSDLHSADVSLPSVELAELLVSHICWENNVPITWKFVDKALVLNMVPPMLVLALFSPRLISLAFLTALFCIFLLGLVRKFKANVFFTQQMQKSLPI